MTVSLLDVLKQLWRYQGNFTAVQKSILLSVVTVMVGVVVGSWWPFLSFHAALPLGLSARHMVAARPRRPLSTAGPPPPTSTSLTTFICEITRTKRDIVNAITTLTSVRAPGSSDEGSTADVPEETPESEIGECLINIRRDFVNTWYSYIGQDDLFLDDVQDVLDELTLTVLSRLRGLNLEQILPRVVLLLRQHVVDYQEAQKHLMSQPYYRKKKDRTKEFKKVKSLIESLHQLGKLHVAVKNDGELEILYLRCIIDAVFKILMPPELYSCNTAKELIQEVLVCQVLAKLVAMFSDPDWLHQVFILVLSDEVPVTLNSSDSCGKENCENPTQQLENASLADQNPTSRTETSEGKILQAVDESCGISHVCEETTTKERVEMLSESVKERILTAKIETMTERVEMNVPAEVRTKNMTEDDAAEETLPEQQSYVSEELLSKYFRVAGSAISKEKRGKKEQSIDHNGIEVEEKPWSSPIILLNDQDNNHTAPPTYSSLQHGPSRTSRSSPSFRLQTKIVSDTENLSYSGYSEDEPSEDDLHGVGDVEFRRSFFIPSDDDISVGSNSGTLSSGSRQSPEGSVQSGSDDINRHIADLKRKLFVNKLGLSDISRDGSSTNNSQSESNVSTGSSGRLPSSISKSVSPIVLANSLSDITNHDNTTVGQSQGVAEIGSVQNVRFIPQQSVGLSLRRVVSSDTIANKVLIPSVESTLTSSMSLPSIPDALIQTKSQTAETGPAIATSKLPSTHETRRSSDSNIQVKQERITDPPDFLFKDIYVPTAEKMKDSSGVQLYVLYVIQYFAWHQEGNLDQWVCKTSLVRRRYREFVTLHERLEEHPVYKKKMKGVKGPRRWRVLPINKLEGGGIEKRRNSLEGYLKNLVHRDQVGNSLALREFLAYEGDARIAFVKKAPEGPRIDKVIVKTVSGVFNKLSAISAPSRPTDFQPKVTSKSKGRPNVKQQHIADGPDLKDLDAVKLEFGFLHSDQMEIQTMENLLTHHIHESEGKSSADQPASSDDEDDFHTAHHGEEEDEFKDVIEEQDEASSSPEEGDGFEQDQDSSLLDSQTPLVSAILDLAVQLGQGRDSWVMRDKVMITTRSTLGPVLESFLNESVAELTTSAKFGHYLRLLRNTLWPGGELDTADVPVRTEQQKAVTKLQARRCIIEFFPAILPVLVGPDDFEFTVDQGLEVIQHPCLNRHLVLSLLDLAIECIFPECSTQEILRQLVETRGR